MGLKAALIICSFERKGIVWLCDSRERYVSKAIPVVISLSRFVIGPEKSCYPLNQSDAKENRFTRFKQFAFHHCDFLLAFAFFLLICGRNIVSLGYTILLLRALLMVLGPSSMQSA